MIRMLDERFWSKVASAEADECWIWVAYTNPAGYGQYRHDGRAHLAHRLAYEDLRTEIPAGLTIDHLCRVRACVNPWHLEPVTRAVNTERGLCAHLKRTATHCKRGHEFTPENTLIQHGRYRRCRTCTNVTGMESYFRRKGRRDAA